MTQNITFWEKTCLTLSAALLIRCMNLIVETQNHCGKSVNARDTCLSCSQTLLLACLRVGVQLGKPQQRNVMTHSLFTTTQPSFLIGA